MSDHPLNSPEKPVRRKAIAQAAEAEPSGPPGLSARVPIALKLALAFVLLIASGMITLGILAGKAQTELLEQQMDKFGSTLMQQMAESAREPLLANDQLNLELIINNLIMDPNITGAAIYSDQFLPIVQTGTVPSDQILSSDRTSDGAATRLALSGSENDGNKHDLTAYLLPVTFRDFTVGYVLLSFDYSPISKAKQETIATVFFTISLMLLLAVAVSVYLGRRFTQPIRELVIACQAFADGRFDYRIISDRGDELGILMRSLNGMGEGLQRKKQVELAFSRYVSPQVAQRAIAGMDTQGAPQLGGQHVEASVLFADIVGFTSLSEKLTPLEVSGMLNLYFSNIAHAVHFCHGHIDKYMGDCAMIVFGVPEEDKNHSFNALACAWMILELVRRMNEQRRAGNQQPLEFRIGLNSGMMLAGNMGSTERMEYTVVGDSVNLASRLSHAGEPGQAIFTEEMLGRADLKERITALFHDKIRLRGKSEPVSIYHLEEITDPFRALMLEEIRLIIDPDGSDGS